MGGVKQIHGLPLVICICEFLSSIMVYIYFHFEFVSAFSPALSLLIILE